MDKAVGYYHGVAMHGLCVRWTTQRLATFYPREDTLNRNWSQMTSDCTRCEEPQSSKYIHAFPRFMSTLLLSIIPSIGGVGRSSVLRLDTMPVLVLILTCLQSSTRLTAQSRYLI